MEHQGTSSSPSHVSPAVPSVTWAVYGEVDELHAGHKIPRRGAAIRTETEAMSVLYEDGRPLGRVLLIEFFQDYSRGEPEVTRVQYEPGVFPESSPA